MDRIAALAEAHAIDAALDNMDSSAAAPETKAVGDGRTAWPVGDVRKLIAEAEQRVAHLSDNAAIGGTRNDALVRDLAGVVAAPANKALRETAPSTLRSRPSTATEAHAERLRMWNGPYKELMDRTRKEVRSGRGADPLTIAALKTLDALMTEVGRIERRLARAEVKRDRPLGLAARWPGSQPTAHTSKSKVDIYLTSPEVANYRKAAQQYLRTGQEVFGGTHLAALQSHAVKAMHTEDLTAGGYVVLPDREKSPLNTFLTELSPMRQRATVRTILSDTLEQPTVTGRASARWAGEREDAHEDDGPTLGLDKQFTFELRHESWLSAKLGQDADIDIEAWLIDQVGEAFSERESPAWFDGTGINQPKGLLTYPFVAPASWTHGKFRYLATGLSGGFLPTAPSASPPTMPDSILIDAVQTLKAGHRKNATWLANAATVGIIRKLRDSDGRPLWQPSAIAGQPNTLLGYGVEEDEFMPDVGADTTALGFGDWRRTYQIVDRLGVAVLRNPYKDPGKIWFWATKRVGGSVRYFDAAVFLKFGTS